MLTIIFSRFIFTVLVVALTNCGQNGSFTPPEPLPDDRLTVPKPESRDIPVYEDYFDRMTVDRLNNVFNTVRNGRKLTGSSKAVFTFFPLLIRF